MDVNQLSECNNIDKMLETVTGSAKIRHNRASLNFQYKVLNAMGKYLRILKNITEFFLMLGS